MICYDLEVDKVKVDEIRAELSKCNNLVELIGKASELKRNGEKDASVNRVVNEVRKKLLSAGSSIRRIPRTDVIPIDTTIMGCVPIQINDLSSPSIVYDGKSVII